MCVCVRTRALARRQFEGDYSRLPGPDDRTLVFESRFESGNLRRAVQAYEFECFWQHKVCELHLRKWKQSAQ